MRLYLIRHGETVDADSRRYKGHIDVPLSENGIDQMRKLAAYIGSSRLKGEGSSHDAVTPDVLQAVYCSDLGRALKSAELIAEPHGIEPVVKKELRERHFGVWEGMTFDEIQQTYPEAFHSWARDPLRFSPMEGESTLEVRDRAVKVVEEILETHRGHKIAVVAHGGINRVLICHFLGIPLENVFRVEQGFGALNIIDFNYDYPRIELLNFTI